MSEIKRLPIDPESVSFGFEGNIIADGRNEFDGELFAHMANVDGGLNQAKKELTFLSSLKSDAVYVLGVGINKNESMKSRAIVYDNSRLGIWAKTKHKILVRSNA